METEYQKTLRFCDANADERKSIYENIGFTKVLINLALNDKSKALKDAGVDAMMINEALRRISVTEKICKCPYSNMLDKKFAVELYSDFEEGKPGWARTTSADTIFYFFIDAIVSLDIKSLREFLDNFDGETTAEQGISELARILIQKNIAGKRMEGDNDIDVYVKENGDGHHSAGMVFHSNENLSGLFSYAEYYFEDEPAEEETEDEPAEEEAENEEMDEQ